MVKNIVIISYATYPSNSPRHFRTDELAKEFARLGHNVTLYVLKGQYDYSNYEKKYNINVKSLGKTFFFKFDPVKGFSENLFFKFFRKIFSKLLEFPYVELIFNSYSVLNNHKEKDIIITIAVPYPLHWGAAIYRKFNKMSKACWIADCGDPYMGSEFHKRPFYFKYIEKFTFRQVDYITIPTKAAKKGYYVEFHNKIKVIPQGFNFDEIESVECYVKNRVPVFIYAGIFYEKLRDPRPFLDFLLKLKINFKFIVYTKNSTFLSDYKHILGDRLEVHNYIERKKLILNMSKVDFLLNLENPSEVHSPSKLIDYALSKRPILSINTNNKLDEATILEFMNGNYENATVIDNISNYDIKNVAQSFLDLT